MSNARTIFWLILGILALCGAHFLLAPRGGARDSIVRRQTLSTFRANRSSLVLARKACVPAVFTNDAGWKLVKPFAAPVDSRRVMRILDELAFAPIEEEISDSELARLGRTRADFGLVEPRVSVTLTSGAASERISFGARTPGTNGVYAAVDGIRSVFIVPARVAEAVDQPTDAFRNHDLFSIEPESVLAFDIKRGSGSLLAFTREGERWKVGAALASTAKVRALLSGVLAAKAVTFVWPVGASNETQSVTASLLGGNELDPETAISLTFKCAGAVTHQISFGGEDAEGRAYALVQNGAAIVTVDARLRELASQDAKQFTDSRLFPFEAASVKAFTLRAGDVTYALARGEEGTWRLDAPVSAPADASVAQALLAKLLSLSEGDVRSEGIGVSFSTNDAPVTVSRLSALGRTRLEDLRSRDVLSIDSFAVRRIVRTPGGALSKPVAIVYSRERKAWYVEAGAPTLSASEKGILAVLGALKPLRARRVEKLKVLPEDLARYGLDSPRMTIAVDQDRADSLRRNILIGRRTDGGSFATVGVSDAVFVLSDETVARLCSELIAP